MKILITGGAGFIGSHIAESYLKAGHEVVIVDDLSTGKLENLPPAARFYQLSITSSKLEDIFKRENPEVVNHHAAQINVRQSVKDPFEDASLNIMASLRLLDLAHRYKARKFIFASSGGAIYGEQSHFPADETHSTDPRSPYGITKLTIEKYLQFYQWTHGLKFTALRYANVYGPRQNAHGEAGVIAIFARKLLKDEPIIINGNGKQTRDYVYIQDVVHANLKALHDGVSGIYNVGTGVETDVNTIAKQLIERIESQSLAKHGPPAEGEQTRSCLKPGTIQKIPITSLSDGLNWTAQWFKDHP